MNKLPCSGIHIRLLTCVLSFSELHVIFFVSNGYDSTSRSTLTSIWLRLQTRTPSLALAFGMTLKIQHRDIQLWGMQ